MSLRSRAVLGAVLVLCILAPLLVVLGARPMAGQPAAVILPPWMTKADQLSALAKAGLLLRDGEGAGLVSVWHVQVPDTDSAARLAALSALVIPGDGGGCRPP